MFKNVLAWSYPAFLLIMGGWQTIKGTKKIISLMHMNGRLKALMGWESPLISLALGLWCLGTALWELRNFLPPELASKVQLVAQILRDPSLILIGLFIIGASCLTALRKDKYGNNFLEILRKKPIHVAIWGFVTFASIPALGVIAILSVFFQQTIRYIAIPLGVMLFGIGTMSLHGLIKDWQRRKRNEQKWFQFGDISWLVMTPGFLLMGIFFLGFGL
jgi:hypothetical protein